jgi:hypothetical protein
MNSTGRRTLHSHGIGAHGLSFLEALFSKTGEVIQGVFLFLFSVIGGRCDSSDGGLHNLGAFFSFLVADLGV